MKPKNQEDKYIAREKLKQEVKEQQGWYFITFVNELPFKRPYGFTLFNKPFVLFRNNKNLTCYCLAFDNNLKKDGSTNIKQFKIEERQNEIWFYYGKLSS